MVRGMADRLQISHLLRRATFGPTAAEVDAAAKRDYPAVVADLVSPRGTDAGAAATPIPAFATDPYFGRGANVDKASAQQEARAQLQQLTAGWLARMAAAQHQFSEKLIFFWHGHWATSAQKVRSATLMRGQLETFRTKGFGDFAALARTMVRDPALIFWLDGQRNTRQAPNENLAREFMELFTLGIGAYTEDDVKAAARALTGWALDRATGTVRFIANRHDSTAKTILSQTANFDADSFVDLLMAQPAHPSFLARRLWFRFGATTDPPSTTRDAMVRAYGAGRDLRAMLTALLHDDAFIASAGHLVKQPVEWAVGAIRQLGLDPHRLEAKQANGILSGLRAMGQLPLRPPSVGGWPGGTAWLTTSSLQVRMRLAASLAAAAPETTAATAADLDGVARLLAVDRWTDRTAKALSTAKQPRKVLALALVSPEYLVS
jgi:uncharacterized protein (DUF1800 family)